MFELGARPHPARALYRAYLDQSHVFLGVYWERYGWIAPEEDDLGPRGRVRPVDSLPRLVYVKEPAAETRDRLPRPAPTDPDRRHGRLQALRPTTSSNGSITDDLAVLLSERFLEDTEIDAEPGSTDLGCPPARTTVEHRRARRVSSPTLCSLLVDPYVRLVTLVGPGGIGKTRLGLELARSMATSYADGAVMVLPAGRSLGDDEVMPLIAAAMGITFERATALEAPSPDRSVTGGCCSSSTTSNRCSERRPRWMSLLESCPNLTHPRDQPRPTRPSCRARLHGAAARAVPIGDDDDAEHTAAVELFIERARSVRVDFALTEKQS